MSGEAPVAAATGRACLLFVHAHPDDETLTSGVTMAAHVARGDDVHLLTCTLGEEGEVIPPELAHLRADRDDRLGPWRREELRAAMSLLGVAQRVLGEDLERGVASRYRDSGMAGASSEGHPDAFARADPAEAAELVAGHIRALRPDVVVTYDQHGGYGHPDHIQTHRATVAALSALADEGTALPLVFCILTPQSWAMQDRRWLHENVVVKEAVASAGSRCLVLDREAPYPPSVVADQIVTHMVEEPALVDIQSRALARHATQVSVYDGYYALSNKVAVRLSGREGFAQFDPLRGELVGPAPGGSRSRGLLTDGLGRE
ncbi:MAG: N-acetyl-1-D-myo-inositol-2-amino-2-deoxy-alpha-D-glucopyranoside deacetylase [Dermatophilaceae bacterium]